jgi:hypothetical protein
LDTGTGDSVVKRFARYGMRRIARRPTTELTMTTPSRRAFVSLAALTLVLVPGACRQAPVRPAATPAAQAVTIRFDNLSRESVHVYLIGLKREWVLGRAEPGAVISLRIPDAALTEESFVRLAVIAGERVTLAASRHVDARVTLAQPVSAISSQHWRYSQGELVASYAPR